MKKSPASRSLLTLLAAAMLALPGAPLNAQVNLPALGDSVSQDLDVGAERQMGERFMRQIRLDPAIVQDPLLTEYMAGIFDPLVAASRKLGHIGEDIQTRFACKLGQEVAVASVLSRTATYDDASLRRPAPTQHGECRLGRTLHQVETRNAERLYRACINAPHLCGGVQGMAGRRRVHAGIILMTSLYSAAIVASAADHTAHP